MSHKVSPLAFRLGYTKGWRSNGYADGKQYTQTVATDARLRTFIRKFLRWIPVANVLLSHQDGHTNIVIYTSKTGLVLGKDDENITKLQRLLSDKFSATFAIEVKEVKKPELSAALVADSVARQIEKKLPYRRVVKNMLQKTIEKGGKGAKIIVAGCLNGAAIARRETYKEGTIPTQTLRSDIDYALDEAQTTYGIIGVKVWVYKGEIYKK